MEAHWNLMAKVHFYVHYIIMHSLLSTKGLIETHPWWESAHIVLYKSLNICMKICCKLDGNLATD
jgi:uncharacterized membrane protein YhdT